MKKFAMALAIEHARLTLLSSFGAARLAHRLGRSPGVIFRLQRVLPLESSISYESFLTSKRPLSRVVTIDCSTTFIW